jgi:Starch-binding associating with outer membrane
MKKILLTIFVAMSLFSCENYLEEADSPNGPQDASVSPDKKLAAALTGFFSTQSITMNTYGNRMTYAYGYNVNAFAGGQLDEFTDRFTSQTQATIWENLYLNIDNFEALITFPNADNVYDNQIAIAEIMKAYGMEYIVSLYGDAPYTQAFKHSLISTPVYDNDKEVYKKLFLLLDDARAKIISASTNPNSLVPSTEDIIFHGDMSGKWTDFANTVELKMLLRMSNTTDPEMIAIRSTRFSNLASSGASFVSSDATINPGYNPSITSQFNPMYNAFGRQLNGATTTTYRANVAGWYMARVLMGQETNTHVASVLDPRRNRLFKSLNVVGVKQGDYSIAGGGTAPAAITNMGPFTTGDAGTSPVSAVTVPEYISNGSSRDGYLMLKAESDFLQAEAITRGFLPGGDSAAKVAFENGITASFNFYSRLWGTLTTTQYAVLNASTYINTTTTGKLGLNWVATPNKLEAIMTQKWLALSGIHGIEPFLDHVRTGFPNLPQPLTAQKPNRPYRLIYPQSEYSANATNVPNVNVDQIFTINSSSPFWLQ